MQSYVVQDLLARSTHSTVTSNVRHGTATRGLSLRTAPNRDSSIAIACCVHLQLHAFSVLAPHDIRYNLYAAHGDTQQHAQWLRRLMLAKAGCTSQNCPCPSPQPAGCNYAYLLPPAPAAQGHHCILKSAPKQSPTLSPLAAHRDLHTRGRRGNAETSAAAAAGQPGFDHSRAISQGVCGGKSIFQGAFSEQHISILRVLPAI